MAAATGWDAIVSWKPPAQAGGSQLTRNGSSEGTHPFSRPHLRLQASLLYLPSSNPLLMSHPLLPTAYFLVPLFRKTLQKGFCLQLVFLHSLLLSV